MVSVEWEDGSKEEFLSIFLRDHCTCPECFHPIAQQRLVDTSKIPVDINPSDVKLEDNQLVVEWNDITKHKSVFPSTWLKTRIFREIKPKPIFWGSELTGKIPEMKLEELISGEKNMLKCLNYLETHGICLIRNVPPNKEDTKLLIERIAHIRETIYGGLWDFTPNMEFKDTAYTNLELKPHTDGCYFIDPPGLQVFHLLEHNGSGGQTTLVDGFNVIQELKEKFPDSFEFLAKTPIPFQYKDDNAYFYRKRTIFDLNENGDVIRFNYNNDDRAPIDLPPQKLALFYQSLQQLLTIMRDPKNEVVHQMTPGTLNLINNWRVMHGRKSFTGNRRLIGAYLNFEDVQSRRRAALQRLAEEDS